MPAFDVELTFQSDQDRDAVMECLRSFDLPDGEVMEDQEGTKLRLESASPKAALGRAHMLRQEACDRTGVSPDRVVLSTKTWEHTSS